MRLALGRRTYAGRGDWHGLSGRRACELADLHRSVFQYKKQEQGDDAVWVLCS